MDRREFDKNQDIQFWTEKDLTQQRYANGIT